MIIENTVNTVALIYADLEQGPLGLRSRQADPLGGIPVLRRTLNRLAQVARPLQTIVCCPESQLGAVEQLTQGIPSQTVGLKHSVPISPAVRYRKWAISSWRGGMREATFFDEQSFTGEMIQCLQQEQAQVILAVPAEAVFIDPVLVDGLIDTYLEAMDEMRFTFAHTAPGLSCCVYRRDLLEDMLGAGISVGHILQYNPDAPRGDYINQGCTYRTPSLLNHCRFRFLADNQRSWEVLQRFCDGLEHADQATAEEVVRGVERILGDGLFFPEELEIEITNEPSLRYQDYPHRRPPRSNGPISTNLFEQMLAGADSHDDVRLTLGGIGEPLAHPDLPELLSIARHRGIYAINIETDGLKLHDEMADALLKSSVDVLSVYLDANSPEVYRAIKGRDEFDRVVEQIEQFVERTRTAGGPQIVPHFTKTRENFRDMESFYDRWVRRVGCAVIVGYNDFAGQIPDRAIMDMSPPHRRPCYRLSRSLSLLADGRAVLCGQDIRATSVLGTATDEPLTELWQSPVLHQVQQLHKNGEFDRHPLCSHCKEWHR